MAYSWLLTNKLQIYGGALINTNFEKSFKMKVEY